MTPGPVSESYQGPMDNPNDPRIVRCAFCGEAYPPGTPPTQHEALTAHVYYCRAHPLGQIVRDLAMGIRKMKAYPTTRDKTLAGLLEYLNRCGFGGNPLRETP